MDFFIKLFIALSHLMQFHRLQKIQIKRIFAKKKKKKCKECKKFCKMNNPMYTFIYLWYNMMQSSITIELIIESS